MANKTTFALSKKKYRDIIRTMKRGGAGFKPNIRNAMDNKAPICAPFSCYYWKIPFRNIFQKL